MNRARFQALYVEHYPRVLGICRRLLGRISEPEDAAQEVFMRGFRAFDRYRSEEPFAPWIGTIATNYCIDLMRQRRRWSEIFNESADAPEVEAVEPSAVGTLISNHRADAIAAAVDELPENYRLPIVLAYYADASYDEIAASLGITKSHVGVLLMRGKQRLRENLAQHQPDIAQEYGQ